VLFDWFTFAAQIINFLILMWLLKRFLYQPILNAIDAREQHIADLLAQTETSQRQAAEEQALLLQKNMAFENDKTAMFAQVKDQVAEQLKLQLDCAQQEVQIKREQWLKTLREEQQTLTMLIHQRTRHEVIEMSRRVLTDLSDTALEIQMVKVLTQRIAQMPSRQRSQFTTVAEDSSHSLIVKSAFSLTPKQQQEIIQVLHSQLPNQPELTFEQDTNLLGGIELLGNGSKISWNIADYLAELDLNIEHLLDHKFRSQ
jgi:F-type H+-transporting ATPase subunit b